MKTLTTLEAPVTHYTEIILTRLGWRVRLYLGGTSNPRRARLWKSDVSRGAYVRLWGEQVIGAQVRPEPNTDDKIGR